MALTNAQLLVIKNDILANSDLNTSPHSSDGDEAIAILYNNIFTPNYWVWRSDVSRIEIYNDVSDAGSTWDWTVYKNQSVTEQNAWVQMFMGDSANFGKLNLRAGIEKIFGGTGAANAQRNHCFAIARRPATRLEKLLAIAVLNPPANTGNNAGQPRGSTANPDVMGFEGDVTRFDIEATGWRE